MGKSQRRILVSFAALMGISLLMLMNENGMINNNGAVMVVDFISTAGVAAATGRITVAEEEEEDAHIDKRWRDWFRPLTTWEPSTVAAFGNRNDTSTNITSTSSVSNSIAAIPSQIIYYHVMKTGGTSLYTMFRRMAIKYNHPGVHTPSCGWTGACCGVERPGQLMTLVKCKNQAKKQRQQESISISDNNNNANNTNNDLYHFPTKTLLVASFREPVERTISHYFQVKPCPDGSGGGTDRRCTKMAKQGLTPFLTGCPFGKNYQLKYLDNNIENLNKLDFILRNDLVDESLVLLSIKHQIPILDLLYVHEKVRLSGYDTKTASNTTIENDDDDPQQKSNFTVAADTTDTHDGPEGQQLIKWTKVKQKSPQLLSKKPSNGLLLRPRLQQQQQQSQRYLQSSLSQSATSKSRGENVKSCPAQWMDQLLSTDDILKLKNCTKSCAGLMGRMAFSDEELEAIESYNHKDLILWKEYIVPKYERIKASVLQTYNVTQEELDKVIARYRVVRTAYEKVAPSWQTLKKKKKATTALHGDDRRGGKTKGRHNPQKLLEDALQQVQDRSDRNSDSHPIIQKLKQQGPDDDDDDDDEERQEELQRLKQHIRQRHKKLYDKRHRTRLDQHHKERFGHGSHSSKSR